MLKTQFVDILSRVDSELIDAAQVEICAIDWDYIRSIDTRCTSASFATSTALYLRIPVNIKVTKINDEKNILNVSNILHAEDSYFMKFYPCLGKIIDWVVNYVSGKEVGRVMLVKLDGKGKIPLHIDPGPYFEKFKRFHVIFKTDEKVIFVGPPGTDPVHMPLGHLCQLNNINLHGVISDSTDSRIHLIVDIETDDSRFLVNGPKNS